MRLTIDLDSGNLVYSAKDLRRVTSVSFKRGDSANVEIQFVQDGAVVELSGTTITGSIGFKEDGKYDTASCVVGPASWTKSGSGTSTLYTATPNFNTAALNTLLAADDGDDTNDVASVTLMGEISWTIDGDVYSSNEFDAVVANDVLKGGEASPTALEDAAEAWLQSNGILYRSDITGYTGGTATDLDSIATAALAVPQTVMVKINGFLHVYTLDAGTTAESSPSTIRPDDYAVSTNEKVWTLRGMLLGSTIITGSLAVTTTSNFTLPATFFSQITVTGNLVLNSGTDPDYNATIDLSGLTADRAVTLPDLAGTVGIFPSYSSLAAANAAIAAIGVVFYNTTAGQFQVTTATS